MIASEKLSLVSLMLRCQHFHNTCASATISGSDMRHHHIKKQPEGKNHYSAIHKLPHIALGTVLLERALIHPCWA